MFLWDVNGPLDAATMGFAFRHVLAEAEVLRVTFADDGDGGGGVRMRVRELDDWQPFHCDVSSAADPEEAARAALADVLGTPFDLERDLLLRLGVVALAADRFLVAIVYHHIVSDGYGVAGLLSRRLAAVYTALAQGVPVPELPQPWAVEPPAAEAVRYRDSAEFADDTEFWRTYLSDAPPPAQVPRIVVPEALRCALAEPMGAADRWSQLAEVIGMVSRTLTVPRAEAGRWIEAAKANGVWMSSLVAAATAVFLRHRCDQPEVLFSLVVANRTGPAARTPGLAVNVVPVRLTVPLAATFAEIADAVVDETYQIVGHTRCHYSDIQRASGTGLTERGSFGAAVNVIEGVEQLDFAGAPAHHISATTGAFNELQIGVYTDGRPDSDLFLRLDAPAEMYSAAELRLVGADLLAHIRAVVAADPRRPIGALDVVTDVERERRAAAPLSADEPDPTVAELFARQAERAPDAVALVSGDTAISYRTLEERSTRLAEALRERGVGPDIVVAVALPRSVELVVALLAVVRAGGAYVPIDPAAAAAMAIGMVVRDVGASVLLTDPAGADLLALDVDIPTVLVPPAPDTPAPDTPAPDTGRVLPQPPARSGDAVAVIPLGGSTDASEAVVVTHRNLRRLVIDPSWRDGGRGTVLWHSPHTVDVHPLELWVPLVNGGRVVVAPPGELDLDGLAVARAAHAVSAVWLAPALLSRIAAEHPERLDGLREVWTRGARVPAAVELLRQACPGLAFVIGYGPTEATPFAACHRLAADEPVRHAGAAGHPVAGAALHVLGPGLAPVPTGVTGELYVAGPGVARGYRGRPGRTAERFVPCPFGAHGGLMYRTGDRVRWSAEGLLEYVGRIGGEVVIRDVRVEPAEVEAVLSAHPALAQSLVTVREDDAAHPRLVAYVVPVLHTVGAVGEGGGPSGDELRRYVAGRLPETAVPSVFVVLDRLPVTAAGRVDPAALPVPEFDGPYQAPRTDTERVLAEAFAEVLEVERIGIGDDFFELGGNSLRAIRLVGLIRSQLNLEVSIRTLFAARTITGLSDVWDELARSSRPALRRRTQGGEVLR